MAVMLAWLVSCMRLGIPMQCSLDWKLEEPTAPGNAGSVDFQRPLGMTVWPTASGRRVRHVIYSLVGCPPVRAATYLLVRQSTDGDRKVLAVRATRSPSPSVNLARIRHSGARWGANEVHLFCGARSDEERHDLVSDLCRALRIRAPRRASGKTTTRKTSAGAAVRSSR